MNQILQYLAQWLHNNVSNFVKITLRGKYLQTQITNTERHFIFPSFESGKAQFS